MSAGVAPGSRRLAIDPRLRARRIAVQRDAGRRRHTLLFVVSVVLGLVGVGWIAVHSPMLTVQSVDVTGATNTGAVAVEAALAAVFDDPLVSVDVEGMRRRVAELPWVASVKVHKRWPRGLAIEVVERRPAAALLQGDGIWRLVDLEGRVLATSPGQPVGFVPVVAGGAALTPGAQVVGWPAEAVRAAGRLAPRLARLLAHVGLDPEGGIVLQLRTGGAVWLGASDELALKQLEAMAVLTTLGDQPVGIVDVRVPGAPVHRPPPPQSSAAPLTPVAP